ncbi:hypothetical protein [Pararhizobium sp. A13]|uniref:hypothetical protein n=1 Tax=Pararhizobium sp. A13 TaxID=3133975 RepID=UPI00324B0295
MNEQEPSKARKPLVGGIGFPPADVISQITTGVVSVSLLFGVATLLGKCLAIGIHVLSYITITDVAVNALTLSPVIFIEFAILVLYRIYLGNDGPKRRNAAFGPYSKWWFIGPLVFLPVAYYALPLRAFIALPLFVTLVFGFLVMETINTRRRRGELHRMDLLFGSVTVSFFIFLSLSYLFTALDVVARPGSPAYKEWKGYEICTDKCKNGMVLARFSEVTVVKWQVDGRVAYIANSEIRSTTEVEIRDQGAYLQWSRYWTTLRAYLGC